MKKMYLIITILSILVVCLIFSFKEKIYNISSSNGLWYIYDSNLENIENNMNEITESNDEFLWYVLSDFSIEDTEYKDMLNALVARIRMSYYELTQNKDFYTNSNAILNYRNKDNITEKTDDIFSGNIVEESKEEEKTDKKDPSETLLKQRSGEIKKVYHVKKIDGKWEIILKDGLKVIKTFATKKEAVEYANNLAKSQDGTVLVHASKGKNKGKFIK